MRKSVIAGLAAGALLALGLGTSATAVESGKAELFVLHGIPETPVDVYVNGALTLEDFAPGELKGPLPLPPGDYTFDVRLPDADIASDPILTATVNLAANTSYTAVAHLSAAAMPAPMISLFTNDISATASGKGRLTVRHVAAAPAVDVLADGAVAFAGLENPKEMMADLPVGTYAASINVAGSDTVAFGPADVPVTSGVNTIVYAWGNASATPSTLAVAVQSLSTNQGSPSGVSAGSAPLPADNGSFPAALVIIAALALAGAGIATRVAVKARG